jgi:hypothetical protein
MKGKLAAGAVSPPQSERAAPGNAAQRLVAKCLVVQRLVWALFP